MIDRARLLRAESTGRKVEGRTQRQQTTGEWVDARLDIPSGNELADPSGRRRIVRTPTLLLGPEDQQGAPVAPLVSDQVEVDSAAYGRASWLVTAVKVISRGEDVLGWELNLAGVQ